MTQYIKTSDNSYPYSLAAVKKDLWVNHRLALPKGGTPSASDLAVGSFKPVTELARPTPSSTQVLVRDPAPTKNGDDWSIGWSLRAKTQQELDEELTASRATAKLTRSEFILACFGAGILTKAESVTAAKGDMPVPFSNALAGLVAGGSITQAEADNAEIIWASVSEINRNHPLIPIAQGAFELTAEDVDALFGIGQ